MNRTNLIRFTVLTLLVCIFSSNGYSLKRVKNPSCQIQVELTINSENQPIMDWLEKSQWCYGLNLGPHTPREKVESIYAKGFQAVVDLQGHPLTRERQWKNQFGQDIPTVADMMKRFKPTPKAKQKNVIWEALLEEDSAGVAFPYVLLRDKPKTPAEAHALFRKHLAEALAEAKNYPDAQLWGVCGYASGAHPYAASGIDCVIVERANDDVDDLQTGIAFTRGAARQYGCKWGVDLSLWWGVIYDNPERLPASYHKRHIYLSYFSGAQVLRIEGGHLLYNKARDKRSIIGDLLEEFGQFTLKHEPGAPDVPVAVMLPEDHGWITPPRWRTQNELWNYARFPYRQGDRGMDGFFGAAFPGSVYAMNPFPFGKFESDDPPASPFALSCVTPEYAPGPEDVYYTESPISFGRFHNREQASRVMEENQIEPAPYRPMGDSRWGDVIDVLTTAAPLDVLNTYPVLIVLGPVNLSESLKQSLTAYAEAGGKLVWSVGVVSPEDEALTGVRMIPELQVGRAWKCLNESPVPEAYQFVPSEPLADRNTTVLATTPGGQPLIVKHALGKGEIYTSLLTWYESGHSNLSGVALRMLDEVIGEVQPVRVEGLPVEWTSTRGEGHRTVVVANHSGKPWNGKVMIRTGGDHFDRCMELLTGKYLHPVSSRDEIEISVEVPAYDIRAIRLFESYR